VVEISRNDTKQRGRHYGRC